ncbi:hypothetical protein LTR27_006210 [Elasticomyces elasticus]|nr:hypothetical protein LTR27_006210 [Elasticomyces elasticus]
MDALPQELIDHIGGECEKGSLLSLRLVNKKLAAALRSRFIERYISKRTHLYSIYGLQKLVDLTTDDDLAKHIKEIVLVVEESRLVDRVRGALTESYQTKLCRAETEYLERWEGSRTKWQLSAIPHYLEKASCSITFAMSRSSLSSHPYGLELRGQQGRLSGLDTTPYGAGDHAICCESIITALIAASTVQHAPIDQLDICHNIQDSSFANFPSPFENFRLESAHPTWSMLRSLKLHIGYDLGQWNQVSCWDGLDRFVAAAPALEHVALSWQTCEYESEHQGLILEGMGNAFGQVRVKHIELGLFHTTRQAPVKFLCSQMGSLESVKLVEVGLRTGKGWRRVLRAVVERTTVDKVELNRLWMGEISDSDTRENSYMVVDEQGSHRLVQEGGEAVKKRLMELASKATFTDELGAKLNLAGETESDGEESV